MSQHRAFPSRRIWSFTICCLLLASWAETAGAATLSDNLGATTDYTELITGSTWITASFGTGPAASMLGSATLLLQLDVAGALNVDLYSNSNGAPGSLVGALKAPGSYSSTSLTPTLFSGNGLALSANTTYWLVASSAAGQFQWAYTDDNTGSGIGFQHTWGVSNDAGQSWSTSTLQPMQMRVDDTSASPVPEPAATTLFLLGSTLIAALLAERCSHVSNR